MKKVLAIAALMTVALSVGAQEVKFTVNGVCDKNGATINLLNRQTNKPVATTTVANGKFTFSGSAEKNTLMSVGDEKGSWMTLFFNDGTPVNVNLNDSTLKGSALNERLVGYDIALGTSYSGFMQKVQGMSEEEQKSKMPELQKEMRLYYGNLAANDVSVDNTVQMRTEYYITSGIRGLDTTFIKLAVTEADYQVYADVIAEINRKIKVGCTGCAYCMPCPQGVDIPGCFRAYNERYSEGFPTGMKEYFMCTTLRTRPSNAGRCIQCGRCEAHCPQHIEIRKELKNVKRVMENPIYHIITLGAKALGRF